MNEQIIKDIMNLIESSSDCVACSVDENGFPNAKVMFKAENEGIRNIWFSTNLSAIRTQLWLKNPKASVYFRNSNEFIGLNLTGRIRVHTDNETKQRFWKQGDEQYYPLGVTDPDYCVLCFTTENGNCYKAGEKYTFSLGSNINLTTYKYDSKWIPELTIEQKINW